jgi:hypothetical protein
MTKKLSWTQPCCERCWVERHHLEGEPIKLPVRVRSEDPYNTEQCCYCGNPTWVGIFVRVDPTTVDYPMEKED